MTSNPISYANYTTEPASADRYSADPEALVCAYQMPSFAQ